MDHSQSSEWQKQSNKKKGKQWLKWLRKPQTFRILLQLGLVIFRLLVKLLELFRN